MEIKDLAPWNWGKEDVPVRREDDDRVQSLQTDLNRAFDNFWRSFPTPGFPSVFGGGWNLNTPRVDVSETDDEVEISVELPGLSEEDIDVSMTADTLRIKGEKRTEKEEKKRDYFISERTHGSFQRVIPLPVGLDQEHVKATFRNGVLTVMVPKSEEARAEVRKIDVKSS